MCVCVCDFYINSLIRGTLCARQCSVRNDAESVDSGDRLHEHEGEPHHHDGRGGHDGRQHAGATQPRGQQAARGR